MLLQIRHAAEGKPGEAVKDIGEMAKNAARGAKESAKLMYDSLKDKGESQCSCGAVGRLFGSWQAQIAGLVD